MSNDPDDKEPGSSPNEASQDSWVRRLGKSLSGPPRTREELLMVMADAEQEGLLDSDALSMIQGVLEVSETQVRDIMIPRAQMVVLERDQAPLEMLPEVIKSGHSRFPVIGENKDEVVGILLAKDMLRLALAGENNHADNFDTREVMRPAAFIPESKRLDVLLKDFRSSRNHMAIVVDEYGGVAGLVTIEDVLEEIVGDIDDEYDEAEGAFILRQGEERYLVRALTPIEEFNRYFSSNFSDEEYDTVGGFVMHAFGHMPKRGESTVVDRFLFQVQRGDNRQIHLFQVTVMPEITKDNE